MINLTPELIKESRGVFNFLAQLDGDPVEIVQTLDNVATKLEQNVRLAALPMTAETELPITLFGRNVLDSFLVKDGKFWMIVAESREDKLLTEIHILLPGLNKKSAEAALRQYQGSYLICEFVSYRDSLFMSPVTVWRIHPKIGFHRRQRIKRKKGRGFST